MKNTKLVVSKLLTIGILFLLAVGVASAQSLGDYARAARKNKTETSAPSHHYDNDNLPSSEGLSVVGPPPAADAKSEAAATATDLSAAATERQKTAEDWKQKISAQQRKIDSLNHELDLDQRELRLRVASVFADPSIPLRNPAEWQGQDAKLRADIDTKQQAIDSARQQLDNLQDQAHKAGVDMKQDDGSNKNAAPDKSQDRSSQDQSAGGDQNKNNQ